MYAPGTTYITYSTYPPNGLAASRNTALRDTDTIRIGHTNTTCPTRATFETV